MKYLNFKVSVTLDFTANVALPTLTGEAGVDFYDMYCDYTAGNNILFVMVRPTMTVGAKIYNFRRTLSNAFLSDYCTRITPVAAFRNNGHNAYDTYFDMRTTLDGTSIENTYNEYPNYYQYYASYYTDNALRVVGYTPPSTDGSVIMTHEYRYVFDDTSETEMQMYNDMLSRYSAHVKKWSPVPIYNIYRGDIPITEMFAGSNTVDAVYAGDTLIFPTI